MKHLKLIAVAVGLILVVNATAGAITFDEPWMGPVLAHVSNKAQGTTYNGLLAGGGAAAINTWYAPAALQSLAGNGTKPGEDGWGIFSVDNIYKGQWDGGNAISIVEPSNPLWTPSPDATGSELVGTYYNRQDMWIAFQDTSRPGGGLPDGIWTIGVDPVLFEFKGDTIEMFDQPGGTYDNGAAGSGGRVVNDNGTPADPTDDFYEDKYATVGYDANGNLLPGASLYLSAVSEAGYFGHVPGVEGKADFIQAGSTGSGHADLFYSVTGGSAMLIWDTDIFSELGANNADIRLEVTDKPILNPPSQAFDWLVTSSDPLTGAVVPEPITMLGLFLGIGGLGGYIRKRRQA